jgi:hypothetical protein
MVEIRDHVDHVTASGSTTNMPMLRTGSIGTLDGARLSHLVQEGETASGHIEYMHIGKVSAKKEAPQPPAEKRKSKGKSTVSFPRLPPSMGRK